MVEKIKRIVKLFIPKKHLTVTVQQIAPTQLLRGKNIIVTGGGRGLGYYIAKKCISEGANVLITGRNEQVLQSAVVELGERCRYLCFDVQNIAGIPEFIEQAAKVFSGEKIHCLVSNAGISLHEGNFRNVTEEGWDRQINTNLKGNYFLVKEHSCK